MEIWVVVVERHDLDPIVVTFPNESQGEAWVAGYNQASEIAWPSDFHNDARPPQKLSTPEVEIRRMLNEVREIKEEL